VKVLERFADPAFALFRFFFGVLFAFHGAQKVFGLFGMPHAATGVPLVAGIIELVAGPLIAIGLFAAVAAFIASGQMAVGYFTAHASGGFLPIVNHGELAVLYCFAFLFIAANGAGHWSLDALIAKRSS
jgi:putative oxidoreductase